VRSLADDNRIARAPIDQIRTEGCVIAGSLPPGVETTIYRELAQSLKARQKKVALDTSGETLNHAIEALPTLIKPNIHELEALVKRPLPSRSRTVSWFR
jgi:1-phosphofructokinase